MLAVVAHDAGGAEVLSSYVRERRVDCLYVLDGPARRIFERKLGVVSTVSLDAAVRDSTAVLCGSSWQSDLELDAIRLARVLGRHSTVFLEHWVNYRERLTRHGETLLPDEIWTGDRFAYDLATRLFPGVPIQLIDNPYLADIRHELACLERRPANDDDPSVLYVCEPLREQASRQFGNERHWGYVEEEALACFLRNLPTLGRSIGRVVIRLHPAEPAGKYDAVIAQCGRPVTVSNGRPLVEDIVEADIVVGCQSTAMVIGLLAGKRVVSCIPPGGASCALPFPEIEHLCPR